MGPNPSDTLPDAYDLFRKRITVGGPSQDQDGTKSGLSSHHVVTKLSLSIPTIGLLLRKMVRPMSAREMQMFDVRWNREDVRKTMLIILR